MKDKIIKKYPFLTSNTIQRSNLTIKMKTLRFLLILSLLTIFINLDGQDELMSKTISIKLYLNGYYESTENDVYYGNLSGFDDYLKENDEIDVGMLSLALEFRKEGSLSHEFEIMPVRYTRNADLETLSFDDHPAEDQVISGGKITTIRSYVRYQVNYYFLKGKVIDPYAGLSVKAFYRYSGYNPSTSHTFRATERNTGLLIAVTPGINFHIRDNLALNLNIPLAICDLRLRTNTTDSPLYPLEDRRTSVFKGVFIPEFYHVRLGLSYKIK